MEIKEATNKDYIKIKKFIEKAKDDFEKFELNQGSLTENFKDNEESCFYTENKGEIIGYCYFLKNGLLDCFFILNAFRNKKVGSKLLEYSLNCARQRYDEIILIVKKDNLVALNFFQKFNFKNNKDYGDFIEMKLEDI